MRKLTLFLCLLATTPAAMAIPGPLSVGVQISSGAGRYIYSPSPLLNDDGSRVVYACRNETAYTVTDSIALFKNTSGAWGSRQLMLSPNASQYYWEGYHVCDPNVRAMNFNYGGTAYKWVMTYLGVDTAHGAACTNNEIGIAFATSQTGTFVRYGGNPIVHAPNANYWGVGQASMIVTGTNSMDLFYTRNDGTSANSGFVCQPLTFNANGTLTLGTAVKTKLKQSARIARSANYYYAVQHLESIPAGLPPVCTATALLRTSVSSDLSSASWETIGYISTEHTGHARNHNAALLTDKNGWIPDESRPVVYFSIADEGSSWLWSYDLWSATMASPGFVQFGTTTTSAGFAAAGWFDGVQSLWLQSANTHLSMNESSKTYALRHAFIADTANATTAAQCASLTVSAGTLSMTGALRVAEKAGSGGVVAVNGSGFVRGTVATQSHVVGAAVNASGLLSLAGCGAVSLAGPLYVANSTGSRGAIALGGSAVLTAKDRLNLGQGSYASGVLTVSENARLNAAPYLNLAAQTASRAVLYADGGKVTVGTQPLYVGNGTGASAVVSVSGSASFALGETLRTAGGYQSKARLALSGNGALSVSSHSYIGQGMSCTATFSVRNNATATFCQNLFFASGQNAFARVRLGESAVVAAQSYAFMANGVGASVSYTQNGGTFAVTNTGAFATGSGSLAVMTISGGSLSTGDRLNFASGTNASLSMTVDGTASVRAGFNHHIGLGAGSKALLAIGGNALYKTDALLQAAAGESAVATISVTGGTLDVGTALMMGNVSNSNCVLRVTGGKVSAATFTFGPTLDFRMEEGGAMTATTCAFLDGASASFALKGGAFAPLSVSGALRFGTGNAVSVDLSAFDVSKGFPNGELEKSWTILQAGSVVSTSAPALAVSGVPADYVAALAWSGRSLVCTLTARNIDYARWQNAYAADWPKDALGHPVATGPLDDARGNGLSNLAQYALGKPALERALGGVPQLVRAWEAGAGADAGALGLDFTYNLQAGDIGFTLQVSTDMKTWRAVSPAPAFETIPIDARRARVRCTIIPSQAETFYRVQFEQN